MSRSDDDDLRARLAALDPAGAHAPVDPVRGPRAADRLERTVQQTVAPDPTPIRPRRPRWPVPAAATAAAAAAVTAGVLWAGGGDPGAGSPSTLALTLPPSDVAASCLVFDVAVLAQQPVAFAGTADAVEPGRVTLEVDRWYRGGDADLVTLSTPAADSSAVLDGVDFRAGERYLVSAGADGSVAGCGLSGPATPELEAAFDSAFPG